MSKLQEHYYGETLYAKEHPIALDEFQNSPITTFINKMNKKNSDIVNLLYTDEIGKERSIVISKNEQLAKKMDIPFSLHQDSLPLFEDPNKVDFLIKHLSDNTLETTKKIVIDNEVFFSFSSIGTAASKVFEFVEETAMEISENKQKKMKPI